MLLPFRSHYELSDGFYMDRITEKLCKDGEWREIKRERINRMKRTFEMLKWILND